MRPSEALPMFATVARTYRLLWRHRLLHAKAIWPPVVFLVTAEFLYHRVIGTAHGMMDRLHAALAAPWYVLAGTAFAWLLGLKFLLSFSISWRRHLLLREKFDPFFFKRPFWKYLAFLLLTYVWAIPVLAISLVPALLLATQRTSTGTGINYAVLVLPVVAGVIILLAIIRQVPHFTVLALGMRRPGWRHSVIAMRGIALRYATIWLMVMLPIALLNLLLDFGLQLAHADPHRIPVALGESAFRQAMLFLHFSLGASLGALTYVATLPDEPQPLPASQPIAPDLQALGA
ncbi:MAG: hypothetical protein ACRYGI_19465 [Janthinobacterium lividum]